MNIGFFKNKHEFKAFFDLYYPSLCSFALNILEENSYVEDVVQEAFIKLWEKSADFSCEEAAKSFLYISVKNKCLNYLEHTKVTIKHAEIIKQINNNGEINNRIIEEETHRLIYNSIDQLPDRCKEIILLSINGLKNNEIGKELNISENTVKTQKKIAYKYLKIKLKDVYAILFLISGNFF